MENKKFWSKSGIVLGIILVVINILISILPYNNPGIVNPHEVSDLVLFTYPNVLLGFPIVFFGFGIINTIFLVNHQTNLFINLFILLSSYWFFVGVFIAWIYNKLSKRNRIFLISILIMIILGVTYFSLSILYPRPRDLQAEEAKAMQGKHQVPCPPSISSPGMKCWEPN